MAYRCPECGSTNVGKGSFRGYNYPYDRYNYKCFDCDTLFDTPAEDVNDSGCCPSCGSSNTAYYKKKGRHHCYDCDTNW